MIWSWPNAKPRYAIWISNERALLFYRLLRGKHDRMIQPSDIALAHHWLVTYRGGEIVLDEFLRLFPEAEVHTLVRGRHIQGLVGGQGRRITASPLQWIPRASRYYKALLPLHPLAITAGRVGWRKKRFVFSSDAAMIKGIVPKGVPQVCYCHSPPRYLWNMQKDYAEGSSGMGHLGRWIFKQVSGYCRDFDRRAADRVSHFIANSHFVQSRIRNCYQRESVVIHPPCHVEDFNPFKDREDFYLLVSHLTPYKRVDIAVKACKKLGRRLVVIGEGGEGESLKKLAGPTVEFLGKLPREDVVRYFERCAAFLYPQIEDFGITAVEAQAAGAPVIAFRAGGALESVLEGRSGLFFDEQNEESLMEALLRFEKTRERYLPSACRANAEKFSPENFREKIKIFLKEKYPEFFDDYPWPQEV